MNVKYRLFLVGFLTWMWLSASVFAGSLAAPELDVPKDKANKSGYDNGFEMETGSRRQRISDFCGFFRRNPEKSGARRSLQGLLRG